MMLDQAPYSDCFGALKHANLIDTGMNNNEIIEFPKVYRATSLAIEPEVDVDTVAFGWRNLSDTERLSIVRSSISQSLLDEYYASKAGQILITRAAQLHLDFAKLGPHQSALLKELTENAMIRMVTNSSLGQPAFAEVISTAERHLALGEEASANFLRLFAPGTPAQGIPRISVLPIFVSCVCNIRIL